MNNTVSGGFQRKGKIKSMTCELICFFGGYEAHRSLISYDNVSDFNIKTFSEYAIMLLRRNMTLGHGKMMKKLTCRSVLL